MALAATDYALPATATPPGIAAIQRALMWAVGAGGAIVFIEPSPYEIVTLASVIFFFATGLRMRPVFIPLLILLFLLNIGYTICSIYLIDKKEVLNWILTSWYMAVTALFFAMVLCEDTAERLESLRRGLIFGALIASLAAIAGYFHLAGSGGYDLFTLYSRARGTFKDPNVLGAYLILPAMFLLQSVVTQPFAKSFRSAIALGIVSLAVLLAFSRASWGQLVACSAFMLVLMYLTTPSPAQASVRNASRCATGRATASWKICFTRFQVCSFMSILPELLALAQFPMQPGAGQGPFAPDTPPG